jgi:hypothetical protein
VRLESETIKPQWPKYNSQNKEFLFILVNCNLGRLSDRYRMTKRLAYIFIFFVMPLIGYSQTMHDLTDIKFKAISDSLIKSKTDSKFRESITYERTREIYYYSDSSLTNNDWINQKPIKGVNVVYQFADSCNQIYSYQTKGIRRGGFEITFDFNYKIVKKPDFKLLLQISKAHKNCYISYETAQKIAIENSEPKSRKTWTNELVYDLLVDKVYWLIEREFGFRKGVLETIKIDATNKVIIEKTSIPYRRGFFSALSNNVFKVP